MQFRGSSEPLLAHRRGITPWERVRLWWGSSPDFPLSRVATRLALTGRHVYVERRDGTRTRIARERVRGFRAEGPFVLFGVTDAEDLILPSRPECELQGMLESGDERTTPMRYDTGLAAASIASVALATASVWVLEPMAPARVWQLLRYGPPFSESGLTAYAGLGLSLLALFLFLWAPSRVRVDRTGILRRRGVIPWLAFRCAPEEVRGTSVQEIRGPTKSGNEVVMVRVLVDLRTPRRVGTWTKRESVPLDSYPVRQGAEPLEAIRDKARRRARHAARLLGVPAR